MALTQGHEVLCCDRNRRGGLKTIYLVDKDQIDTIVYDAAANKYTSFMTDDLYNFQFDRYTGGFDANATRENGSTVVNVQLNFYIPKVTAKVNKTLNTLSKTCGVIAIVETYADDCVEPTASTYHFVLGYDEVFKFDAYLDFVSAEESTGVALQDANGAQIALGGDAAMFPAELLVGTGGVAITANASGDVEDAYTIAAA